jgi:hypothetical protein
VQQARAFRIVGVHAGDQILGQALGAGVPVAGEQVMEGADEGRAGVQHGDVGFDPHLPLDVPQAVLVVGGDVLAAARVFPVLHRGDRDAGQHRQGLLGQAVAAAEAADPVRLELALAAIAPRRVELAAVGLPLFL